MRIIRLPLLAVGCLAFILSTPLPLPVWAGIVFQPVAYLPGQADSAPADGSAQEGQSQAPDSVNWPREFKQDGYTFTAFQPQVDSWKNEVLEARQAVQVEGGSLKEPTFGSVFLQAKTSTNMTTREVTLSDIKITKADFPTAPADVAQIIQGKAMPKEQVVSLDQLTANLARTQEIEKQSQVPAQSPAPEIFVNEKPPAILVLIGGKPQLRDVENTSYQYVFNSQWLIVFNPKDKIYSLLTDKQWIQSKDLMKGPWSKASQPAGLEKAPKESAVGEALANAKVDAGAPLPAVYVSTKEASLLSFQGAPNWVQVPDTGVSYANNISQPVLKESNTVYVLLSGRWFSTNSLEQGPWEFVQPDALPKDFANLPADSTLGQEVLPSVPDTPEAKEAVITAQIPHKATINNDKATLKVTYDGEPKFEPVTGVSGLARAINTSYTVLAYENKYYCCDNAVWFIAGNPMGPWAVTADVPQAIYTIPPSSPAYNVTYVKVYDSTPETTTFGYTAGYLGAFIAGGLLVYGLSQLWEPRYYWYGRYYYPPPYTYGWGYRHYNPYTGAYRARGYWGGPYYRHTAGGGYNPWNGNYAYGHRSSTPYASWGRGVVGNTNTGRWAEGGYYDNWHRASAGAHGSEGNAGFISHNKITGNTVYGGKHGDNYYVGRDGNVYKYNDGNWSKYNKDGWNNVQKPNEPLTKPKDLSASQRQQLQDKAKNLSPEQRQQLQNQARDKANNLSPEQRKQLQQNAPDYAKKAQDKASNMSPEQRKQLQQNAPDYAKRAQEKAGNVNRDQVKKQVERPQQNVQRPQQKVQRPEQKMQRPQQQVQRQQRSNYDYLERQRAGRSSGQQRSREFHSRRSGGGGGGFHRGGGGRRR